MPPLLFQHDLLIDGQVYKARRVQGGARGSTVEYIPQQAGVQPTVQLDPATQSTWHRGSGASRKMLPGMHGWTRNGWTVDPGYATAGPLVTTVALPTAPDGDIVAPFVEQDGHIYFAGGRRLQRIPNGSGAVVDEQDLGAGFVAVGMRRFKNSFFVSGKATGNLWEKISAGAWTQAITGGGGVQRGPLGGVFWSPAGVTRENLVAQVASAGIPNGIQYIQSANDPRKDTDWLPGAAIDIGTYPITSIVSTRDHVYLATTGGLRDLDSSGLAPNLTPEAESLVMATNGQATIAEGGWIYYGAGYGLLRVRVANANEYAEVQNVTPKLGLPDESPVFGLPQAITRYRDQLIFAQWDSGAGVGGTTYISWGRQSLGGYGQYAEKAFAGREVGPMVWNCSPIVLPGLKVTRMHTSGTVGGNPRLWIATVDNAGVRGLCWAPLALSTPYQDLRQGRAYQFCTSWDLYESYEDWGDDTLPKIVPDIQVEAENLGVGTSMAVFAVTDGNPSSVQLGTLNASPMATLTPPTELRGNRIQIQYSCTGTILAPAILRKTSKRAIGRPDLRELRHYQLIIGRAVRHAGGGLDGVDPLVRKQTLARLQTGSSVTARDDDGQNLRILIAAGIQFAEVEMDVAGKGERMQAVTISFAVLQTAGTTFKWGDGTKFGDPGKVFS